MNEDLSVIGVGRLGLCWALSLEESGISVLAMDRNEDYLQSLAQKEFRSSEPGVNELLRRSKDIRFTSDVREALMSTSLIFVLVPTPSRSDGTFDHSSIDEIVEAALRLGPQTAPKHLVISSTTHPGYCESIAAQLEKYNWQVSYFPEFIAQGSILADQANPSIVLIGEDRTSAGDEIVEVARRIWKNAPVIHRMDRRSAEIAKLGLNCFLTTKVTFANMLGDIALGSGADPDKILAAIGSDPRVGPLYLKYGFGYGGPCFPRDNKALVAYALQHETPALIARSTDESNALHLEFQVKNFIRTNPVHVPVKISPITFKPNAASVENSQPLAFAVRLAEAGYHVELTDHARVLSEVRKQYGGLFAKYTELP